MAKIIFKTGFKFPSQMLGMVLASLLLFNACDSGSGNTYQSGNAYVSFSIAKSAPSGGGAGNVSIQQFESVTSIIITVSDGKGHSVSGDIWKNNGNLTLTVQPHTPLTVTGVAYEGGVATYQGETTVGALRPGEVVNVSFPLDPITAFADPGLATCVSDTMGSNSLQSYAEITTMDCSNGYGISDLSGIEKLINLQTLDLSACGECSGDNYISDLTPLSGLVNLVSLNLRSNYDLVDVTPLQGLTKLQSLDLSNNSITDISALAGLTSLQLLDATSNQISDISAINTMTSLVTATLSYNNITSVSLAGLPNLQTLALYYNNIARFVITNAMPQLNNVNIGYNHVAELSLAGAPGDYPNLNSFSANDNNIRNVADLAKATQLQSLSLFNNTIEDVTSLSSITTLTTLHLFNNDIKSGVPTLSALTGTTVISLSTNPGMLCTDVQSLDNLLDAGNGAATGTVQWDVCFTDSAVQNLTLADANLNNCVHQTAQSAQPAIVNVSEMTGLSCPSAGIVNLTGIDQLVRLQSLDLSGNTTLTNFSGLSGLKDLGTLDLRNTNLAGVSALSSLKNLQSLYLDDNPFTSIGGGYIYSYYLGRLTNLTTLSLANNLISGSLQELAILYKAQTIDLTCSPTALEPEIIALDKTVDNTLDGQDGSGTGVVRWTLCP